MHAQKKRNLACLVDLANQQQVSFTLTPVLFSNRMEQYDFKCRYCCKNSEARDYSMARQSRIQKHSDFNFREIFAKNGGQLKRAEKEDTIEIALPGAFSLDSEDSPRMDIACEQEVMLRYSGLGPTCVRFLGLHRVLPLKPRELPHNFALVAIGTRSNPFPELWSSSGAFCEEHLQELCVPLKGPTDQFRSDKGFQSFSCEFCFKKGTHSAAAASAPRPLCTNLHKVISKRAALRLMLLYEEPPQEQDCSFLEQNFFFRWKFAPYSEPKAAAKSDYWNRTHPNCAKESPIEFSKDNWLNEIQKRFKEICDSAPDLQGYVSSVMHEFMKFMDLKSKESTTPLYLNPNFKDILKSSILKATERDSSLSSSPHRKTIAELHADIIATILAQSPYHRNQHFLRLDQLKASSGFFECEAINKHLLLDCSSAQATVIKIPKLSATFTDAGGKQLLPQIDLIGISDSWLYAAGDPYLRCDKCTCEDARQVVIIGQNQGVQQQFYQQEKWINMSVKGIDIDGVAFESQVAKFESQNKVRLKDAIPDTPGFGVSFVLFFEYPLHVLAGDLRVKIDAGDKAIKQVLQGGDYAFATPQALPSDKLFSIRAIFSLKPNASPLECHQYWKFRIGEIVRYPVPVFHHFWDKCPMLANPWKNAQYQPRGNNYCVVPPQGNCILNETDNSSRHFVTAQCYHFFDPTVARHCSIVGGCSVCIDGGPVPTWLPARSDLCNDFIPLIDCVTDVGQSKWGLHFERDSTVSPSHSFQPQGGVLFVYVPANLGKVQKDRPEILGFVGTSSPVLSMDVIERERSLKTVFVNGFREIFESLLVSCFDGRVCVVNSPRVPIFVSPESPSDFQPQSSDHLRSIDPLKSYLKDQLQDSSHQHALFNGSVIDYVLRLDSGPSTLKSFICSPACSPSDATNVSYKCEGFFKHLHQSLSKSPSVQKHCVSQEAAAAHKKTSLEQLLLRKFFLNVNITASMSVEKGKTIVQARDALTSSFSSQRNDVDNKISKAFYDCLLKIYRLLHQGQANITALNFIQFRHGILSSIHRNAFKEMNQNLLYLKKTVTRSLGFHNSTVDLSRAELHFLQCIREEFDPFQNPPVTCQMALELLTPVCGLKRLQAYARSVHFLDSSANGWFQMLALVNVNSEGRRCESRIYHYKLRIPISQIPEGQDFLSSWLPQHSSFVEVGGVAVDDKVVTKCPHGLRVGDLVRFCDPGIVLQKTQLFKVSQCFQDEPCSFKVTPKPSPKIGSFVQLQPRFFPFQKLEQVAPLRISSPEHSQVKCLIVRKKTSNFRQAAWIEVGPARSEFVRIWSTETPNVLSERFKFDQGQGRVECACFLEKNMPSEQEATVALGCSFPNDSRLFIFRKCRCFNNPNCACPKFHQATVVQGTLPSFTRLKLLPTDDALDPLGHQLDDSSFILVAATKLTEFNESAFFLHVTIKEETREQQLTVNVKCCRSISEIRATSSNSRKPTATTPLRASYPTFSSIDVIPIRSNAQPAIQPHIDDSWLYFHDCSTKYFAKVHESNRPLNLSQYQRYPNALPCPQWAIAERIRLLDSLKAEHFFIQFLPKSPPPPPGINAIFYDANLRNKIYQIPAIDQKSRIGERDSSFDVSTASPNGRHILSQIPSGDYTFQVVVPSDIDGEYGHESGIAKFAFLLDSPSMFSNPVADNQFRAKARLFAVPLRSWFPRLVQGKFGNNLN